MKRSNPQPEDGKMWILKDSSKKSTKRSTTATIPSSIQRCFTALYEEYRCLGLTDPLLRGARFFVGTSEPAKQQNISLSRETITISLLLLPLSITILPW